MEMGRCDLHTSCVRKHVGSCVALAFMRTGMSNIWRARSFHVNF